MIPEGMRDVLPPETAELRAVEDAAAAGASRPTATTRCARPRSSSPRRSSCAGDDTLAAGYRLFDEQGRELMLRTDMTVPVARLAADALSRPSRCPCASPTWPARSGPGRRSAARTASSCRPASSCSGLRSAAADAECVTLLCDALGDAGPARLSRGARQRRLLPRRSSTRSGLERRRQPRPARGARRPRLPAAREHRRQAPILDDEARRALQRTLELSGTRDALAQARKLASTDGHRGRHRPPRRGARPRRRGRLRRRRSPSTSRSSRTSAYYSGVIFEAYAPGVGLPIASGGRYDGLLARFDWDIAGGRIRRRRRARPRRARRGRRAARRAGPVALVHRRPRRPRAGRRAAAQGWRVARAAASRTDTAPPPRAAPPAAARYPRARRRQSVTRRLARRAAPLWRAA